MENVIIRPYPPIFTPSRSYFPPGPSPSPKHCRRDQPTSTNTTMFSGSQRRHFCFKNSVIFFSIGPWPPARSSAQVVWGRNSSHTWNYFKQIWIFFHFLWIWSILYYFDKILFKWWKFSKFLSNRYPEIHSENGKLNPTTTSLSFTNPEI